MSNTAQNTVPTQEEVEAIKAAKKAIVSTKQVVKK